MDCHDNKSLQSTLNRIQAEVYSALGTILAESEQVETHSHRPRATIIREAQAMTDVHQAKPRGHKYLDTQTVKLAWGIPEHMAGVIGGEQDGARLINDERGVRRSRENIFQGRGGMH